MKLPKAITLYPKISALFPQSLLLQNCHGTPCRILFFLNLAFHQKNLFLGWLENSSLLFSKKSTLNFWKLRPLHRDEVTRDSQEGKML